MRVIDHLDDSVKSPSHPENEDKVLTITAEGYSLFFLFDGVGSALHALDAVQISTSFISSNYKNYEKDNDFELAKLMYDTHLEIIKSNLSEALSTYVALHVPHEENLEITISSMGDSRIYGVSNQYVSQYTEDDSVPNVENVITKSLGMLKLEYTDFSQKKFIPKEARYLVCSDGFYKLMEKNLEVFYETLNFSRFANIKKKLLKDIVGNNTDDASYILIKIHV